MILDVGRLEIVKAIAEEGTLTEAARKLEMSQPAMSRQLANLEREIGSLMFRRHHRGMTLTREGERVLDSAHRVLIELGHAEEDVKLLAKGYAGTLRVATECYMCYHWLPWVARRFGIRYPNVELQLAPQATRNPYGALRDRAIDLALVYSRPAPLADEFALEELFRDELVAIVANDHHLADSPYLSAELLRDQTLLCHYVEFGHGPLVQEILDPAGVRPERTIELMVTPAVIEMARAGYGVAVGPRWIFEDVSLRGLRVLPLTENGLHRAWLAATLADRQEEPLVESLLESLHEELADADPGGVVRRLSKPSMKSA